MYMDILRYVTPAGKDVVGRWLADLPDVRARAKVVARLTRLAVGNFGDCRYLRAGVWELRIDWGPGYRVYYARSGQDCILLLCGGDKRRQAADIKRAVAFWAEYRQRRIQP